MTLFIFRGAVASKTHLVTSKTHMSTTGMSGFGPGWKITSLSKTRSSLNRARGWSFTVAVTGYASRISRSVSQGSKLSGLP